MAKVVPLEIFRRLVFHGRVLPAFTASQTLRTTFLDLAKEAFPLVKSASEANNLFVPCFNKVALLLP